MAGDRRNQPWAEMLQQNDDKHDAAHKRLRADHRELEEQHEALKAKVQQLANTVEQQQHDRIADRSAPIDIGKIMFAPKLVLGIIALVMSILGGTWFINQPIVSRLDRFEERMSSTKDVIDGLTKAMEMRRLEIQSLSNTLNQFQQQQLQQQRNH